MAVPKRRQSRARRDSRRANWKLKHTTTAKCGHCAQPLVPHRVCPHCGFYGGVEVMKVGEE